MVSRSTIGVVAVAVLLVLAGCSGGGSGGGEEATTVVSGGDAGGKATDGEGRATAAASGGAAASASIARRYRVRTAEAVVRVDNFSRARESLVARARDLGGYVGQSNRVRHESEERNRTWTTGSVTLRVPSENFSAFLAAVRASGEVQRLTTDTRDVTGEVIDLQARLRNLRAQRDRLRDLYRRANDTEALLRVQQRLSEVQSQIEQLKGRLRALKHDVAYSTVTVELREEPPSDRTEGTQAFYEVGLVTAFLESVHGVVVVGRSILVLTAYALPYLGAVAVPVGGAAVLVRYVRNGG